MNLSHLSWDQMFLSSLVMPSSASLSVVVSQPVRVIIVNHSHTNIVDIATVTITKNNVLFIYM